MLSAVAPDRSPENAIPSVTPGVFFGAPVALPRGPHALPRADVLAEQRERLMAAMTDLIAAGGYTRVTIGALASRAKVSRTAFYECFPGKEACAFAAYDRFIEVLLGALAERAGEAVDLAELIGAIADGYFSMLERDLVAARAFLVEFDALGLQARDRRRVALRGIASYLRQMHEEFRASDPTLAPLFAEEVYLGIVYVARQLACDALEEQRRPNLRGIGEILAPWLLTVYRPDALARPAVSRVPSRRRSAR
ncbi:MAG: TetR/AcrR family transcriptional regulator [Actinobacteria bacterium]|nr:MAG: TetR/AcrR family transcriptional regulator [Actinomycetota bacterium]